MLDDVALLEEHFAQHSPPFGFAAGQELERHREVLELLLLGVLHDRLGLRIALERDALLVPTNRFRLLLKRGGEAREGPNLLAQLPWRFVILLSAHSLSKLPSSATRAKPGGRRIRRRPR